MNRRAIESTLCGAARRLQTRWQSRVGIANRPRAGYRVHNAQSGKRVVLLLIGGSKRTQSADIRNATGYWKDFQERTP